MIGFQSHVDSGQDDQTSKKTQLFKTSTKGTLVIQALTK